MSQTSTRPQLCTNRFASWAAPNFGFHAMNYSSSVTASVLCLTAILVRPCPLWVKSGHGGLNLRCPLYPRKRTFGGAVSMSALCQKRTLLVDSFSSAARPDELVDQTGSATRVGHDHSAG